MRTLTVALLLACLTRLAGADPLAPLPDRAWSERHAAHLLSRAGFGGTPDEIALLARLGRQQAVDWVVDYATTPPAPPLTLDPPGFEDPRVDRLVEARIPNLKARIRRAVEQRVREDLTLALMFEQGTRKKLIPRRLGGPLADTRRGEAHEAYLTRQAEKYAVQLTRTQLHRDWRTQLRRWWIARMATTPRPLEEVLTLFWHGHFATSFVTVQDGRMMAAQNALLRRHATDVGALLRGIVRDPAMMRYLDADSLRKARPNENLARELLELFTLGPGHYSERDIKEAARALTGASLTADGRYRFERAEHDYRSKTFLGQTGRWFDRDIVRILLEQPRTAQFIVGKLVRFFTGADGEPALVDALAATLREHAYRLEPVLRRLFASRAFYARTGQQVKSPARLVAGSIRNLGLPPAETARLVEPAMERMGQPLLEPRTVAGYPDGQRWINTSTLLSRYNLLTDLVAESRRQAEQAMRRWMPAPGPVWTPDDLLGLPIVARARRQGTAGAVVAYLVATLIQRPLPAARRRQLEASLGTDYDGRAADAPRRILRLLVVLLATPEYQLG